MKCPICKKDDSSRKLAVVLDEGTSTSSTLGLNIPLNNHRKHQNDAISVSGFSTKSSTKLVERLQPPTKPYQKWEKLKFKEYKPYFLITSAVYFVSLLDTEFQFSENIIVSVISLLLASVFFGATIGGIIFLIVKFIKQQAVPPNAEVKKWNKGLTKYRNSYYCYRDDICFNEEFHDTPYRFKVALFY